MASMNILWWCPRWSRRLKCINQLEAALGRKSHENEMLKEAVEYGKARKWNERSPSRLGDEQLELSALFLACRAATFLSCKSGNPVGRAAAMHRTNPLTPACLIISGRRSRILRPNARAASGDSCGARALMADAGGRLPIANGFAASCGATVRCFAERVAIQSIRSGSGCLNSIPRFISGARVVG